MFRSDDFLPTRPVLAAIYARRINRLSAELGEGDLVEDEVRVTRVSRNFAQPLCIRMSWTGDDMLLVAKHAGPDEISVLAEFEVSDSGLPRPQELTVAWSDLPRRPKTRVLDGEEWFFEASAGSYQAIARRRDNMEVGLRDFCASLERLLGVRVGPEPS